MLALLAFLRDDEKNESNRKLLPVKFGEPLEFQSNTLPTQLAAS